MATIKNGYSLLFLGKILIFICIILFSYYVGFSGGNKAQHQTSTVPQTPSVIPTGFIPSTDIINDFINAKFRVVKVQEDPKAYVYIIVATERSIDNICGPGNQRCTNDTACGAVNVSPHCYFFTEPDFYNGMDAKTKFLGQLNAPNSGLVNTNTQFTFPDSSHAILNTTEENANRVWQLDIINGGIIKLSEQRTSNLGD